LEYSVRQTCEYCRKRACGTSDKCKGDFAQYWCQPPVREAFVGRPPRKKKLFTVYTVIYFTSIWVFV